MMIDAILLSDDRERFQARQLWEANGGDWYTDLPYEYKLHARKLLSKVTALPNAINVDGIGVVHAECPLHDWELLALDKGRYLRESAMWSRKRLSSGNEAITRNIDAVVVGHSPVKEFTVLGNHVYIDLGSVFNGNPLKLLSSYEIRDKV